ncbi:TetR/AcrR family transcriptional regulator [Ralstonia syzygii]|uniref:TetR/AcrR family transcriptional regulator n=1 Tax=Ralstonia syzygii TaxID=28097 RepID=UPI0036F3BC03
MSVTAATAKTRTPRGRRTQEERSDTTQRKIIQSALKLLQNKGIRAANLQEIARGARVTLGAVQHHFTNRQVLMERLIDEVMAPLSGDGAVWPSRDLPLDERAHEFVRTCWRTLYGSPNYVAAWSLFYGCKAEPELFARIDQSRAEADPVFFERFIEYFPEIAAVHEKPARACQSRVRDAARNGRLSAVQRRLCRGRRAVEYADQSDCVGRKVRRGRRS